MASLCVSKASRPKPKRSPGRPKRSLGQPMRSLGQAMRSLGQPKRSLGQAMRSPGQPMSSPGQPMRSPGQPMRSCGGVKRWLVPVWGTRRGTSAAPRGPRDARDRRGGVRGLWAGLALAVLLAAPHVYAADAATPATEPRRWYERLSIHGYADVYYGFNTNRPADGLNFIAGTGTTGKRANHVALNLAALDVAADLSPVAVRLIVQYGSGPEILYGGEPRGGASGPDVWKFLQVATVGYTAPLGRGLLIEAGIFPSHAGFEGFPSKDSWNYTRGWNSELLPYYQAGLKLSYAFTDALSAQLYLLNGWQLAGENNEAKTLGAQLAWNGTLLTAVLNGLFGPELPSDNGRFRLFGDLLLGVRPTSWLRLMTSLDVGYQQLPGPIGQADGGALWWSAYAWARVQPLAFLALALRGGYYDDRDGYMTGTAQALAELTGTVELRAHDALILKLEGRYDHSTAAVFGTQQTQPDGSPVRSPDQALVMLGAVAAF